MSRYIDADALSNKMYYEAFENDASYNENNPMAKWDSGLWIRYKMFENAIADAPSIDIVFCENCRKSHIDGKTTHYLWCTEWGRSTDTFGHCERGEREGE